MQPLTREIQSMEDTYFIIEQVPEETTFEEEMLLHNVVEGLLPMETGWHSGDKFHRYHCTGLISLTSYLQGKQITGEQFEALLTKVFDRIRHAKEFLLREDGFYITPDSLYINPTDGTPNLCYWPEYHRPLVDQMKDLSTWFLEKLDVSDASAVYDGYAFHVLCHKDVCNFDSISSVLEERLTLPEVTVWEEEEAETDRKDVEKHGSFLEKAAVFVGSIAFVGGVGALLLFAMR